MGRTQLSKGSSGIRRTSPFPPENVTPRKGSYPHKYKFGQVVKWAGMGYYRIAIRLPLHCDGGCPGYYLDGVVTNGPVSESVLYPLTDVEKGE